MDPVGPGRSAASSGEGAVHELDTYGSCGTPRRGRLLQLEDLQHGKKG